jgi:peptidoglycan glycosyltransferase
MMIYNFQTRYMPEIYFPGLYYAGAKTGTAELGDGSSHAWFTGFLDDAAHPYAFVVVIERAGSGLAAAAPAANRILHAAIAAEG